MADTKSNGTWLESMFAGMTGLFDGFSAYMQGEASAGDALARASTATFNARQARLNTAEAIRKTEATRRDVIGGQRVARAKQGVTTGGSGSLVIDETDRQFAMDVLAMKHRGALTEIERQSEAAIGQVQAKSARKIGKIGAFGSLLKAGVNFSDAYNLKIGRG